MKVLFVGDAVVSSGFARCTHAACDALHDAGHEVHVLGINYFGDPHDHPYAIYPAVQPHDGGHDVFGVGRLPVLTRRLEPDVIVLLQDPWNVPAYMEALKAGLPEDFACPPVVGWLAVDGKNQQARHLDGLAHVAVWTQFAVDEFRRAGYEGPMSVVPLGVDLGAFGREPGGMARTKVLPATISPEAFIVGVVGRNQPRKRLDLTIGYFAEWVHSCRRDDAYLYLHVAPTGEAGFDIASLVRYHGVLGRVIASNPHIGRGAEVSWLRSLYSAMDVYLTTTQGEGWGLPCLEAMACGTPCIVPDWSALGCWPGDAVIKVPCTSTAMTAPMNGKLYTVGGVPDLDATVRALDRMYSSPAMLMDYAERGREQAKLFPWAATGAGVVALLEREIAGRAAA